MSTPARERLHAAFDLILDALDEIRSAPAGDELIKLSDVAIEKKAKARLVRDGKLKVVKLGRENFTRRSDVAALVDLVPAPAEKEDELVTAIRKRAQKIGRAG